MPNISAIIQSSMSPYPDPVPSWNGNFGTIKGSILAGLNSDLMSQEYPMIYAVDSHGGTYLNGKLTKYLVQELNRASDNQLIDTDLVKDFVDFIKNNQCDGDLLIFGVNNSSLSWYKKYFTHKLKQGKSLNSNSDVWAIIKNESLHTEKSSEWRGNFSKIRDFAISGLDDDFVLKEYPEIYLFFGDKKGLTLDNKRTRYLLQSLNRALDNKKNKTKEIENFISFTKSLTDSYVIFYSDEVSTKL